MLDTMFDGIYRDDALLVFDKQKYSNEVEVGELLAAFQEELDALTCSRHLQFTVNI
jgi:hypothetical protein